MKRLLFFPFTVLFIASIAFSGCEKEEDVDEQEEIGNGTMSAKINGVLWTATDVEAVHSDDISPDLWVLVGRSMDQSASHQMHFNIYNSQYHQMGDTVYSLGLYQCCDVMRASYIYNPADGGYDSYENRSNETGEVGQLVITSDDGSTVNGTFEFLGHDIITDSIISVTEGQFSVKYTD